MLWNCINTLEMIWKSAACSVFPHAAGNQKLLMSPGQGHPLGTQSLVSIQLPEEEQIHHNCSLCIQERAIILKQCVSLLFLQFPFRTD